MVIYRLFWFFWEEEFNVKILKFKVILNYILNDDFKKIY